MLSDHVTTIRIRYYRENCTFQSLADEYGISQTSVGNIIRGRIYPELPGPLSENNARRKLTDREVKAIRQCRETHEVIAKEFGVSTAHVSRIRSKISRP